MKKSIIFCFFLFACIINIYAQQIKPAIPSDPNIEAQVEKTLSKMTLDEKINQLEKRITELSQPPVQHEDIELTISTENCETHGPFECRTRHFLNSVVKIPPRPSCCPECLKEELGRLQAER